MARYGSPIDLFGLELRNATIQNLAAAPSSPGAGRIYYDTALVALRYYNGSAWQNLAAALITAVNGTSPVVTSLSGTVVTVSVNAASANTANYLVQRDGSGNFTAGTITATAVTGLSAPVNPSDAVTKTYADAISQGVTTKASVTALATSNLNIASPGATIDGVTMTAANRVLLTGQTTASQNGLWVWNSATTALTRPTDFAAASVQAPGILVFVEAGTANANSQWIMTGTASVTVDTTAETWTQFSGAAEITFNAPLSKSGNTVSLGTVGIGSGGTGQTTAAAGFNALSPLTTLGDVLYGGTAGAGTRLAGSTTNTRQFLLSLSSGGVAAAPSWTSLAGADVPVFVASGASHAVGVVPDPGASAGTARFLREDATWVAPTGTGTVTSVALTAPAQFSVSGSPVTGAGTLALSWATESANTVLAGPASGIAAAPTFRTLVVADLPTVDIAHGGTGQTTASAGFNALSPVTTLGDLIVGGAAGVNQRLAGNITAVKQFLSQTGTGSVSAVPAWAAIAVGDLPTVDVAHGGTNATTAAAARTNLAVSGAVLAQKVAATITGNGSLTSFAVTHNLGTFDVSVTIYDSASPANAVIVDIQLTDANTVTIVFGVAVANATTYRVVVVG